MTVSCSPGPTSVDAEGEFLECHYVPRSRRARRGLQFNPECPHSVLPTVERGLRSELNNKATSTRKCMLENHLSLGSDNGEIEVVTNLSSKYIL